MAGEVLEAIAGGRILSRSKQLDLPSARMITDFALACDFAWEQDLDGATNWNDLRSHRLATMKAEVRARPELAPLRNARLDIETWIRTQLAPPLSVLPESIASDVAADLFHSTLHRAVHGRVDEHLFERILQAYLRDGWPCGWEGRYPEGQLVVFRFPANSRLEQPLG